jgi:hydroxymethylpyrimidine pyrophosphatase-like HAD family hydrolase
MHYSALATDYDGTLATHGRADREAMVALDRLAAQGWELILVTGRQLPDLKVVFPEFGRFDRIVAENGALLYCPETGKETVLCDPVPQDFVAELRSRGASVSTGRAIVATVDTHQKIAAELIQQRGLKLEIILNKGSIMILPAGVDKASGLKHALSELNIPPQKVVAVGDAENDAALLALCGFRVAVANALPALKNGADLVTRARHGAGVAEAIAHVLADNLPAPR